MKKLEDAVRFCDSIFKPRYEAFCSDEPKVLLIDLSQERIDYVQMPRQWIASYVAGPNLAARIWAQFYDSSDQEPVVITTRGQNSTIAFKNYSQNRIAFNTITGSFADKLAKCNFEALVIKGKLRRQGFVTITATGGRIEFTENLRGKSAVETAQILTARENTSCITIGKSGENLVDFATCVTDGTSYTGRGGLGAVFGSKELKAIAINVQAETRQATEKDETPYIEIASHYGWAPVRNFTDRTDPRIYHLSEKEFKRICGTKKTMPHFTDVMMLGCNTGCFDIRKVMERYQKCLESGLEPVTVGAILGIEMQGNTDSEKINEFIEKLSQKAEYNPNILGPYDYRGNFTQAVSDLSGNWFPVLFNANPDLCQNNRAFWATLSEDIVLGLQSLGLSTTSMIEKIRKTSKLRILLFKYSIKSAEQYFAPQKRAEEINKQYNTSLNGIDILTLGRACKRLIFEINKALDSPVIRMPDHFTCDPDSAYEKAQIVPAISLMQKYQSIRNLLFAQQDSVLFRF